MFPKSSTIDGLWVVMVQEGEEKVPMLARSGADVFLLAFKTGFTARKFAVDNQVTDAEPRMLVATNAQAAMAQMRKRGATGVLVDYDASTQTYKAAEALA
jgi:hypothetical protein